MIMQKITFDIKTLSFQNLDLANYKARYPEVDVNKEFIKMRNWLIDNPSRRKQDYARFISNWLNKALDNVPKKVVDSYDSYQHPCSKMPVVKHETNLREVFAKAGRLELYERMRKKEREIRN
jgi:hypothetical protein